MSSLAVAYLDAIELPADIADAGNPSLSLLNSVYHAHITTHPFSTANIKKGIRLSLDATHVLSTYCQAKQGGVCMEASALVAEALKGLGFSAYRAAGEVFWAGKWTFPLSHHSVLVDLPDDGTYMLDVGFPMKPFGIVKMEVGLVQRTADGKEYEVTQQDFEDGMGVRLVLNVRTPEGLVPLHRLVKQAYASEELQEAVDWLYSAEAPFAHGWMMQIHKPDGTHLTIAQGSWAGSEVQRDKVKLVVRPPHGAEPCTTLLDASSPEVQRVVEQEFRASVVLPEDEPIEQPTTAAA